QLRGTLHPAAGRDSTRRARPGPKLRCLRISLHYFEEHVAEMGFEGLDESADEAQRIVRHALSEFGARDQMLRQELKQLGRRLHLYVALGAEGDGGVGRVRGQKSGKGSSDRLWHEEVEKMRDAAVGQSEIVPYRRGRQRRSPLLEGRK